MENLNTGLPDLSISQREIMDIVWEKGEISAREVREVLSHTRDVARNTVRTLLERMEEKGWLVHREQDRTFLYSPERPREVTMGYKISKVIDQVCGGSPEALMTAILDYRGLTVSELKRIRSLLDDAKASLKSPKKNGS